MSPFLAALFGSVVGPLISRLINTVFGNFKRKELERDALATLIVSEINLVLEDCTRFWGQSGKQLGPERLALAATIQARVHSINMLQTALFDSDEFSLKNTRDEWRSLYRFSTGGDIDEEDRPADGARLRAILLEGYQLRHGVAARRSNMRRGLLSG